MRSNICSPRGWTDGDVDAAIATGEWLIDKLGEDGLPAELRRKLMRSGRLTD
jgi:hypothetical protein